MRKFKLSLADYARQTDNLHLIEEYHTSNPVPPTEIGFDSTINVRWECGFGHEEIESPKRRCHRGYCSVCGPRREGSLAQIYPYILDIWSDENTVSPYQIPPTYSKSITWKCPDGHTWTRKISQQLKIGTCPSCTSSLFVLKPELLKEWDSELNSETDPMSVSAYSNKKYYWKCSAGHSYVASPEKLMRRNTRCPICASFGHINPDAAREWHPTKNEGKTPYDFPAKSQKEAWFICSKCGNEYSSRIAYRAARKTQNCPLCKTKSGR